ncbi:hypothetical protein HQ945_12200 [Phyllobacterium sp. BT25]|uniref:Uncharacterized protein n=1 Tax=Phyllobacterium pellucidum TaxID=2740464 RepID=A0A849VPV1_9HYPH|nr:hypothetical protein [Phyllobacterium pellucidum]NTS32018.1 hypothetical protein [Phyllobacterium pellucidum]
MNEMREKRTPDERRLAEAIRGVQIAAADRGDVVIDMKEADLARIEILAEDLKPVFADVPADDPQWDFAISRGVQPRLWIDATAHVMMARDRRTYRFVRDTRLGRIVLAESPEVKNVSEAVTTYIAERIVERQRLMEGERVSLRSESSIDPGNAIGRPAEITAAAAPRTAGLTVFLIAIVCLAIGATIGTSGVLAQLWSLIKPIF